MGENREISGIVWRAIEDERLRQLQKWGEQLHLDEKWIQIILEEFGELAKAILEKNEQDIVIELIQMTACCVAWLEVFAHMQAWRLGQTYPKYIVTKADNVDGV